MTNLLKNIFGLIAAFIVASPLLLFFDITINGYFNPQYGFWSQSFLNGGLALGLSVVLFALTIGASMVTHSFVVNRLDA